MSVRYLVDTDVLLDLINGLDEAVEFLDSDLSDGYLATTAITVAEVYAGVYASRDPDRTRARIEHFFATTQMEIIPLTTQPARIAGLFFGSFVSQGQMTGLPDLLNAAIALDHKYTIVTRNIRHYERVPKLKIVSPAET
ncbi:MAG: type II toxin-antitoxin system VapC family toxin [Thermomicrobiales bacterium]|nr:type II toxin-antitoxin system VapC family toxin [Thermomicrobiales bacterium]